jgi:zinc/manganese transport system permease protein
MTGLLTVDPFSGLGHMLSHPFEVRALIAGTAIAAATGLVGYFVVLRSQVFTGDALSHVAFTGAMAALAIGIDLRVGLFASCVIVGMVMAVLGRGARADDVVIGNVFAWVLGLGVFFLTVYTTGSSGGNGTAGVNVLFGSVYGLSDSQAAVAVAIAVGIVVAMVAGARPLLFASIDPDVARARGIPVAGLGVVFLALVGVTAGEATQAVGALLLLGLLASPAGAAQKLTANPYIAMWTSAGIAIVSVWIGLAISYAAASIPPSFGILSVSTGSYVAAALIQRFRSGRLVLQIDPG